MNKIRFKAPGSTRGKKGGTIFETWIDEYHGTTYYVEDEDGVKYQLSPGAILAAEETGDK